LLENPKFGTESTQTPLRELTIQKNFKVSTSEFTKIRHFEIIKQKIFPLPDSSQKGKGVFLMGRGTPLPNTLPLSALRPPQP